MRTGALVCGVLSALLTRGVSAQEPGSGFAEDKGAGTKPPPFISLDAIDVRAHSRFHLSTRFTFDDGNDTFSKSARFLYEAHAAIRITEGLAIFGTLPFGLDAPSPGANGFFFGNLRLGVGGGGVIEIGQDATNPNTPIIGIGGGFDVYAPTAPELELDTTGMVALNRDSVAIVRGLRAYDPELYLAKTMSFRGRGHVDFTLNVFAAHVEIGLAPAFTVESDSRFFMFFHWLFRLAVQPVSEIEPYIELGSALHLGADAAFDLTVPAHLTFGARGHFGPVDPALFVTIDLKNGTPIFGIDLAGILRGTRSRGDRSEMDFLDGI